MSSFTKILFILAGYGALGGGVAVVVVDHFVDYLWSPVGSPERIIFVFSITLVYLALAWVCAEVIVDVRDRENLRRKGY